MAVTASLATDPTLAALRARLAGDPEQRPQWDDSACPRCGSDDACPQWCTDDDLVAFPVPPAPASPGSPLCTCTLGRFGGIAAADPNCPAVDCAAKADAR